MLAFAPPLSHNQTADGPATTSTAIRSRSTPRPCPPSSTIALSTGHSSSNQGTHRDTSKRTAKSSLPTSRLPTEDHRNEPPIARINNSADPQAHPNQQPLHSDDNLSSTDLSATRSGAVPPALESIHEQDPSKLLQLLASLLHQIASANDQIRLLPLSPPATEASPLPTDDSNSTVHHPPIWDTLTSASRQAFSTPTACLAFHARNIPTITLEAYLLRILKYCPTTNEVFLSLLVYFDRMSKMARDATGKSFVIDSFNVHRLVIAGVTVASKFFSDVFYTNSRYAKVGGLPQSELNQLELQFLLLNDFRLSITTEEMQRYAEQLQIYSRKEAGSEGVVDGGEAPLQSQSPRDLIANSMRRMGAADAYGGRLPGEPMTEAEMIRETYSGVVGYHKAMELEKRMAKDSAHKAQIAERHRRESSIESGAEADEEGAETDDEPTIRAHSSAGSETQSLCTVESEDAYSEREQDDECDAHTPERGAIMSP